MGGIGTALRLAAIVVTAVLCATVLSGAGRSQTADDPAALNEEAMRLSRAGKYVQATQIAKRVVAIVENAFGPEHRDTAIALNNLAELYRIQGRHDNAEPLFRRSVAILEKAQGREHPDVAAMLNNLGAVYRAQGRYANAEQAYKRSLAIRVKALGAQHPDVGLTLNNLGELYLARGRYAEAEPLLKRGLAVLEKTLGAAHPNVGLAINNLASFYKLQGRYGEAEPLFKRVLAIREKTLGASHPDVGLSVNNLADLYEAQGRYGEAELLFKRSLAIWEKSLGAGHPNVGLALNNLGSLYETQGRYAEAEPLYKRSLAIYQKAERPSHPDVALSLNNLARLYEEQDRDVEAEPLHRRSLAIRERALGPWHPDVALSLNNLAGIYQHRGRYAEAEPLYQRSLAIWEKALGPGHPKTALALNNLASVYHSQGRYAEAEQLYQRSLAIREKAFGPEHPDVGLSFNNLANLYQDQDRYAEAERLYQRSLAIREKALGPDHPLVEATLDNLAWLAIEQRNWAGAADYWRRSTGVIERRVAQGLVGVEGLSKEAQRSNWEFWGLIKMTHRLAPRDSVNESGKEMFETAQWAQASDAASALAQMATRSAGGSPDLAALVRERQDLVGEFQVKEKQLIGANGQEPTRRNSAAEKLLASRLAAINARLRQIDRRLAKDFPDYAALASPTPASIAEVQAQLGPREALVLLLDTPEWKNKKPNAPSLPEETFIWVVTKTEARWARSELGSEGLKREVAALRCGLDNALWDDAARAARCFERVQARPNRTSSQDVLPFDLARAHAVYKALFGQVEDLIAGKHLLIVPSGASTQLPFQVLVTEAPKMAIPDGPAGYREAAWLGMRQPTTVLPAVSSLKALRAHARSSVASKPYFGIGNPLLNGPDARFADLASKAREITRCPGGPTQVGAFDAGRGGVTAAKIRGGLADVAVIRSAIPLPETSDELCAVAADLKAEPSEVLLGERATETKLKTLSRNGELARYRVLHFATHGAMAGELDRDREPGLILTPPERATAEDDGYVSASEIATLKLDADWVILSACNTAAGGATRADSLSGIARAFIYAGARALLVSHWAVDSNATVKLITAAAAEMARDPPTGRAEAMRRAMVRLIETGTPESHPSYWAPFVVVGEGSAAP